VVILLRRNIHNDIHHQECLAEVLHVDALPVVDVVEAASREVVRVELCGAG